MAERQETSVMVSIQEILRDAQSREEQEKIEAERRAQEAEQRRLDEIRRKQEEEAARLRAEEEERERRIFEEQRRQVELKALQEATIQRARAEAEAQARLAEMTARQEHERQLHAMKQDKHKKRMQALAIALGVFFFVGAIASGVFIKRTVDERDAAKAYARQLESDKQDVEQQQQRLKAELTQTQDPARIAALQAQLEDQQRKLDDITTRQGQPQARRAAGAAMGAGAAPAGGGGKAKAEKQGGGSRPPCNCTPGDPMCSCL